MSLVTPPEFYPVPATAKQLNMSTQGVYNAINRGQIPHVRIGGVIRVPASYFAGLHDQAARSAETAGGTVTR